MISSKIFRSRWSALFWAAGVIWFAYDVATDAKSDGTVGNATDIAAIANVVG